VRSWPAWSGCAGAGITPAQLERADGALPPGSILSLLKEGFRHRPSDEFPTEVALAIPYGAFGILDILAGVMPDVAKGFSCISDNFERVSVKYGLEVLWSCDSGHASIVRYDPTSAREPCHWLEDEFAVAALVGRFRAATTTGFDIEQVRLTRPAPEGETRYQALFGARVLYGCSTAGVDMDASCKRAPLRRANTLLQSTLQQLAGPPPSLEGEPNGLELAIRAKLRALLPEGAAAARPVARALGMSSRTLHRQLASKGARYGEILDRFREGEAERILCSEEAQISDVALRLGFSDQSALTRAFRRWKGISPSRWRATIRQPDRLRAPDA
jgi:AraC-like DNA-binding protein